MKDILSPNHSFGQRSNMPKISDAIRSITATAVINSLGNSVTKENLEFMSGRKLNTFLKGHLVLVTTLEDGHILEEGSGDKKPYEFFHIFDQNEKQILLDGRKAVMYRCECHGNERIKVERPLFGIKEFFHRGTAVFIVNKEGVLLLPIRSANKDLYRGMYDVSVGEHLQPFEEYSGGAVRGSQEELNYKVEEKDLIFISKEKMVSKEQSEFVTFFKLESEQANFRLSEETSSVKFVKISDFLDGTISLEDFPFRTDLLPVFKKFIESYNN